MPCGGKLAGKADVTQYNGVKLPISRVRRPKKSRGMGRPSIPISLLRGAFAWLFIGSGTRLEEDVFEVTWFQAGAWKRKTFRNETEALDHADGVVKAIDRGHVDTASLTSVDAQSFRLAKTALSGLRGAPPLHSVVEEYVAAKELLGHVSLLGTVRDWIAEKSVAELKPIQAPELVREFLAASMSTAA
jgi:hypothetical protein